MAFREAHIGEDAEPGLAYTAYRPDGKEGEIVAFTKTSSATGTDPMGSYVVTPDNMLGQFLSHNAVRADTLETSDPVPSLDLIGSEARARYSFRRKFPWLAPSIRRHVLCRSREALDQSFPEGT